QIQHSARLRHPAYPRGNPSPVVELLGEHADLPRGERVDGHLKHRVVSEWDVNRSRGAWRFADGFAPFAFAHLVAQELGTSFAPAFRVERAFARGLRRGSIEHDVAKPL